MYKIEKDKSNNIFLVLEKDEHIIKTFATFDEAKSFIRAMKKGAGFNGHTPHFITNFLSFMKNFKEKDNV